MDPHGSQPGWPSTGNSLPPFSVLETTMRAYLINQCLPERLQSLAIQKSEAGEEHYCCYRSQWQSRAIETLWVFTFPHFLSGRDASLATWGGPNGDGTKGDTKKCNFWCKIEQLRCNIRKNERLQCNRPVGVLPAVDCVALCIWAPDSHNRCDRRVPLSTQNNIGSTPPRACSTQGVTSTAHACSGLTIYGQNLQRVTICEQGSPHRKFRTSKSKMHQDLRNLVSPFVLSPFGPPRATEVSQVYQQTTVKIICTDDNFLLTLA